MLFITNTHVLKWNQELVLIQQIDFNQVIALDHHELDPGLWYFDLFSRLSMAVVIRSKEDVIIDKSLQKWVAIYSTPEIGLFTDNGFEFNKTFQEMAEKLNLSLKTTAAYFLWSNGIVEHHNAIDKSSLRAVLSVIAQHNWSVNTIVIKTAFLQGEEFEQNVYIKPPAEAKDLEIKEMYLWFNRCIIAMASESKKNYVKIKRTGI